ncbi:MAG: DUF885 family protein, partial [Acidobacteriota bacterium]|nr:DUF885 family protein [Acidobacteriota bacterium]
MNSDVARLADRIVAARFAQEPLEAALLGLDHAGAGLADLTEANEHHLAATFELIADDALELHGRALSGEVELDEFDRLTLDLVRMSAATAAEVVKVPLVGFTVTDIFFAPLSGLISVLPMLPLDTPARRDEQLGRLGAIPLLLDQLTGRHREALAAGRAPVQRGVRAALAQIAAVTSDRGASGLRRPGADLDAGFVAEQDRLIDDVVVPAIRRYGAFLEAEVLERGRPDEQSGLSWLPGGDEMYRHLVRAFTSTERSAQDLHDTGLAIIERLKGEFADLGTRLWGTGDVTAIHDRLRHDPALRYESSE